jgi:hypothetical protein
MNDISKDLVFDDVGPGSGDILDMLKNGTPTVDVGPAPSQITIYVAHDDAEEVKNAKDNIQFVVDSAREAVTFLLTLGKQTGNPRFFETVNSLLNTINGASGQLIGIDRKKKSPEPAPTGQNAATINNIQDNRTIVMSTSDALRETANQAPQKMKTIEG